MLLIPDPSDQEKDERGRSSLRATVAIRGIDSGQLLRMRCWAVVRWGATLRLLDRSIHEKAVRATT